MFWGFGHQMTILPSSSTTKPLSNQNISERRLNFHDMMIKRKPSIVITRLVSVGMNFQLLSTVCIQRL